MESGAEAFFNAIDPLRGDFSSRLPHHAKSLLSAHDPICRSGQEHLQVTHAKLLVLWLLLSVMFDSDNISHT